MANNRPIKRRPWRRPPWRKNVRPKRWNASSTTILEGTIAASALNPLGAPWPAIFTIVDGQVDVEPWADDQEVTLDRVVGNISLFGSTGEDGILAHPVYVRMGMLVHEEAEAQGGGPQLLELDLAEQETLEDFEWMWLHSVMLPGSHARSYTAQGAQAFEYNIPVDIRNRRKIGQSDELLLFAQWATLPSFSISINCTVDLRSILMSR